MYYIMVRFPIDVPGSLVGISEILKMEYMNRCEIVGQNS